MRHRTTGTGLAALGMLLSFGPLPILDGTACQAQTELEEVVMYGIDSSSHHFLRYKFETDDFVDIGLVVDQFGAVVQDCEALTYIPNGPAKGIYAAANFYESSPTRLMKINGIDASAYKYPVNVGFNKIEGMTAVKDWVPNALTDNWSILAVSKHHNPGDGDHCLLLINPATGVGSMIMETAERYDGLALSPPGTPAGQIYGWARDDGVWRITPTNPPATREVRLPGTAPFTRVDTLEWAWGDVLPLIDATPFAPAAWTANGILFGFDDDSNKLLILDPATGNAVVYPSAFDTIDCEGLAFTTQIKDPYGPIVSEPMD